MKTKDKMWDAAKAVVLRGKVILVNAYIKKKNKFQSDSLTT